MATAFETRYKFYLLFDFNFCFKINSTLMKALKIVAFLHDNAQP